MDITQMWHDVVKYTTIAIVIHLLAYVVDDYGEFFDEKTLKILLYLTVGIVVYYIVVKRYTDKKKEHLTIPVDTPKKTKKVRFKN